MKLSAIARSLTILVILLCAGGWIFESQTKFLRRTFDDVILDNRNHYLPCDQLPSEDEVRQVMQQYQDTIKTIEEINPGSVGVEVNTETCPGRADLLFWYGTHQDRLQIESVIAGDTFFGIPYQLQNR